MSGKFKLKHDWCGGGYFIKAGTEVWFERHREQLYMVFHEGKVKVVNQVLLEPALSLWFIKL